MYYHRVETSIRGTNAPSLMSPMVDEGRTRLGYWLGYVCMYVCNLISGIKSTEQHTQTHSKTKKGKERNNSDEQ